MDVPLPIPDKNQIDELSNEFLNADRLLPTDIEDILSQYPELEETLECIGSESTRTVFRYEHEGEGFSGETFERTVTVTEPAWIEQEHSVNGNGDVVAVSPKKADVGIDELMPQATYVTDEGDELRNWDEARNYLETGELPR
jgi:hypothetical protein